MAGQDNQNAVKFSFIGDHPLVRRIGRGACGEVWLVRQQQIDPENRGVLHGWPCPDPASFHRLRSGGLMRGDSLIEARPRCGIYRSYLKRHLR